MRELTLKSPFCKNTQVFDHSTNYQQHFRKILTLPRETFYLGLYPYSHPMKVSDNSVFPMTEAESLGIPVNSLPLVCVHPTRNVILPLPSKYIQTYHFTCYYLD